MTTGRAVSLRALPAYSGGRAPACLRTVVPAHQRIHDAQSVSAQRIVNTLCPLTDGTRDALGSVLSALEAPAGRLRDHAA